MNVIKAFGLSAVAVSMVACTTSNSGNSETLYYNQCFNVAEDYAAGTIVIDDEVAYTLVFNYDDNTVDITAQSLQISPNGGNATVNFGKIPFTYDGENNAIKVSARTVNASGYVSVSDLNMVFSSRTLNANGQYIGAPIITLNYMVNNTVRVTAFMRQYIYVNNATVVNATDGAYTQSNGVLYTVTFNEPKKMEAIVTMDGVKYAEDMQPLQLILNGVEAVYKENGYALNAENLVPKRRDGSTDKEAPEYAMTGFNLDATFTTKKDDMPAYLNYGVAGKYSVRSVLSYYQTSSSSQD